MHSQNILYTLPDVIELSRLEEAIPAPGPVDFAFSLPAIDFPTAHVITPASIRKTKIPIIHTFHLEVFCDGGSGVEGVGSGLGFSTLGFGSDDSMGLERYPRVGEFGMSNLGMAIV